MVNPARGEVALKFEGGVYVMRLTLGALAELEGALGAGGMIAVAERFESGDFSASDLIALLTAGVRGGGADLSSDDVAALAFEGGAGGAARAAAELLKLNFGGSQ